MTLDDAPPAGRPGVAVGPSASEPAPYLVRDHDDVVLRTYADLRPADLEGASSVEVLVGPGSEDALRLAVAALHQDRLPRLLLSAPVERHGLLLEVLRREGLGIDDVLARHGATTFVVTAHPLPGADETDRRVLAAVASVRADTPAPGPTPPSPAAATSRPGAGPAGAERPTPPLVLRLRQYERQLSGRRRTRLLGALGGLGLVVLVLLVLAALGGDGAVALLVALVGLAALLSCATVLVAVLMLSRQVHRQTARLESMLRRQGLAARADDQRQADRARQGVQRHEQVLDHLESIAAAEAARGRDLHVALGTTGPRSTATR